MSFSIAVKEQIARIIAEHFTTNRIVNVFADANIPADQSLFAKWKIALDAFGKMSDPEASIPDILVAFCHPLNFQDPQVRHDFIKKLNAILAYENLALKPYDRATRMTFTDGSSFSATARYKTPIDYIIEAVNFFKNEYNKVRISGLSYEYLLGENIHSNQVENGREGYDEHLKAVEELKKVGFITEYAIDTKVDDRDDICWDFAVCKIDESKLVQKEESRATEAGVQALVQRIEITAMPKLQIENVGANAHANDKKRESPIELSFPEPVQWDKVTLKIKEGRQGVEIFYGSGHIITADYIQLRFFVGKKQQRPDRQWGFLCALATLAATDIKQATAENMRGMITQDKTLSVNNVHQAKKLFTERLQDIFKTSDDPFHGKREYYEPMFKILPEPALRREEVWPQGGRLNENRGDETDRLTYEEKRILEENEEAL